MTVHELNRDRIIQLKQYHLMQDGESVSWLELANADEEVSDEEIFAEFAGTDFTDDDFFE